MRRSLFYLSSTLVAVLFLGGQQVYAAGDSITVNVDNFARAETDMQIGRMLEATKGVNKWNHNRLPTPLDKQTSFA